jgi:hypothetical protein
MGALYGFLNAVKWGTTAILLWIRARTQISSRLGYDGFHIARVDVEHGDEKAPTIALRYSHITNNISTSPSSNRSRNPTTSGSGPRQDVANLVVLLCFVTCCCLSARRGRVSGFPGRPTSPGSTGCQAVHYTSSPVSLLGIFRAWWTNLWFPDAISPFPSACA